MKRTGLRAVAASMSCGRFPGVGVGDLARSAFPPLGLRVSCGEPRMRVDVREALKRGSVHGIRKATSVKRCVSIKVHCEW